MTTELTRHQKAMLASNRWDDEALLSAGYSASALLSAGYSLSALLSAGYSASDLPTAFDKLPILDKPYTHLLTDIREKKRLFKQSTFGPDNVNKANICKTPMCTAGHLVSMAGKPGRELRDSLGWAEAAALIHAKAHPDHPCQNFGSIPDDWALAYIEEMAEIEAVTK